MASLTSRSAGISRLDGLRAAAAELCRIVRASYLSPSFPFFLCFELWRYLHSTRRDRRPRRKVTRGLAGSPSLPRLLRGAALAVMLMLPAEGWAQVPLPAACVSPQGNAALPFKLDAAEDEQQVPPLRFAPVEDDTSGLGTNIPILVPSRPERTRISCHAARVLGYKASDCWRDFTGSARLGYRP